MERERERERERSDKTCMENGIIVHETAQYCSSPLVHALVTIQIFAFFRFRRAQPAKLDELRMQESGHGWMELATGEVVHACHATHGRQQGR